MYKIEQYATAKNSQQGYLSPADFNLINTQAQQSYVEFLLGRYQDYRATRPIPVVQFGQNERIRTSIAPLIYEEILPINPVSGISPFPYGFLQVDAMWTSVNYYNIRFTGQDRLNSNFRSVIDPIEENPVYLIRHEGFQFFPPDTGSARMSFVKNPPSITWGYTLDANGRAVYDPLTSTQPVWADPDILEIIVRALAIIGVNLQMATVLQYSQEIKNAGQ